MLCTNCRKPHNGKFTLLMGTFKVCDACNNIGKKNEQLLKEGIVIVKKEPSKKVPA